MADEKDKVEEAKLELKSISQFLKEKNCGFSTTLGPVDYEKRVMDMFPTKEKLIPHLQNYMQHCVARKVDPTLEVILGWLYSEKGVLDRDDFVSIQRCKEMVIEGNMFPNIVVEVLEYALVVETAAKSLLKDMGGVTGLKSLDELRDAIAHKYEKQKDKKDEVEFF